MEEQILSGQLSLGGAITRVLYSGGQLVGEYNASGGLIRRHIPGASFDETLASLDGAGRTYILPDVRGTPMALVYPNGAVDVERYDAFGIEAPDNVGRFGFTGQMRLPELGLAYFKNRFYDPALGRFLSPDPLGTVDGPNLYAYVLNDPITNASIINSPCDHGNCSLDVASTDCSSLALSTGLDRAAPSSAKRCFLALEKISAARPVPPGCSSEPNETTQQASPSAFTP